MSYFGVFQNARRAVFDKIKKVNYLKILNFITNFNLLQRSVLYEQRISKLCFFKNTLS